MAAGLDIRNHKLGYSVSDIVLILKFKWHPRFKFQCIPDNLMDRMKRLIIQWHRLLDDNNQTCPRCSATGKTVQSGVLKLKNALVELGIEVELIQKALDFSVFANNPLQSNVILINDKPLEEWIGGETGKSKCCDVCGDSECRTVSFGGNTFESIPESLIIKAGLLAAAELIEK